MKSKKIFTSLFVLCLIVIAFAAPTIASAMARPAPAGISAAEPQVGLQAPVSQDATVPNFDALVETAKSLGGFALLFAALVNTGKSLKPQWFPDGSAPKYNLIFQTLLLVGLVVAQFLGKADLVPVFDKNAGFIANSVTGLFAIFYQLYLSRIGHEQVLAGLPLIGTSYSGNQAGASTIITNQVSDSA